MTVLFRPAQRGDAREIARFFQITSEGGADYIWSLIAEPGADLLAAFFHASRLEESGNAGAFSLDMTIPFRK